MARININTSQNVQIEYKVANVGKRILSQIIDFVFMGIYYIAIFYLLKYFLSVINGTVLIILLLPIVFYSFITESIFSGQSFGKMLLKIKVVKIDGSQAGLLSYFIRWIFRLADVVISQGVLAIILSATSQKGQRLGDIAANTIVIDLTAKAVLKHSLFTDISEDYKLQYPEVEKLSEADLKIIIKVMKIAENHKSDADKILSKAHLAITQKMGIENSQKPLDLFQTIIKDYNYINIDNEY